MALLLWILKDLFTALLIFNKRMFQMVNILHTVKKEKDKLANFGI